MSDSAPAPQTYSDTLLDRFVDLTRRKRSLEAELNRIKGELEPIEAQLLEQFADEGVRRKDTSDGIAVFIRREIWARAVDGDKPTACKALRAAGLGDLVQESFNTNTLSAHFRAQFAEREGAGEPITDLQQLLDPALRGAIDLSQDYKLSVRS